MRFLPALALSLLLALPALAHRPHTVENEDSCDIGLAPAATLLLPYFEVDVDEILGPNTLFTVTNTGKAAQVARVTLWTDFAYPVLTFDLYLTGYDVQSISLHDVIGRGIIGGANGTGVNVSPSGEHAEANPLLDTSNCGELPRRLDLQLVTQMNAAFIRGVAPDCLNVGNEHDNAVGYATIDVVGNCAPGRGPTDPRYFAEDIRYDNVLMGDYVQLRGGATFAQAVPMVHIRALPGGGTQATRVPELPGPLPRLEKTFYGRFQHPERPHLDARQPLPSTFAARWINGGPGSFNTFLQIWRDGTTGPDAACFQWDDNVTVVVESVAFDEDENGEGAPGIISIEPVGPFFNDLPATSRIRAGDEDVFPQNTFAQSVSGWLYLNLDDDGEDHGRGAQQNWVVVTMEAEGRYSVGFDAAWLGNGCSPVVPVTRFIRSSSTTMPGPAEDVNP